MNISKLRKKINSLNGRILPTDQQIVEVRYKSVFGRKPNLISPQTFNEKLAWIICNYRNPLYELCADKVDVRSYVESKGLGKHLTSLYAVYERVNEIDFNSLPDSFVIKTTHSFGGVCIVKDRKRADVIAIQKKLSKSFSKNLYDIGREWQYKNLVPRIMAEEYIEPAEGEPLLDYKIYCFDGAPRFIHVSADIAGGGSYEMDFYDTDWNHLDAQREGKLVGGGMEKPTNLDEMLNIAKILSEEFPHVRVDLYNVNGKIYIGELTFTTAAGTGKFTDEKWDYEFGKYFNLPKSGAEIIAERANNS